MYVRISTISADPSRLDDGIAVINDKVVPTLKSIDGFRAANFMADRDSGKLMGVVFWDSKEAMDAGASSVDPIRSAVADAMDGTIVSVESFEQVAQSW